MPKLFFGGYAAMRFACFVSPSVASNRFPGAAWLGRHMGRKPPRSRRLADRTGRRFAAR